MKEEVKIRGIRRLARDVHTPSAKRRVKKESHFYPCLMLGEGKQTTLHSSVLRSLFSS